MTWHLRDTSRLREVTVLDDYYYCPYHPSFETPSRSYWVWVPRLLHHLSISAPALRLLNIKPSLSRNGLPSDDLLARIGALRQLESLVLRNWSYGVADIESISQLTRLQNLKVTLSDRCDPGSPIEVHIAYFGSELSYLTCSPGRLVVLKAN